MNNSQHTYCYTAFHRGGLEECLLTEKLISCELAFKLIKTKIYVFYAYDERIKADRYILKDIPNNLHSPTWINIYVGFPNHYIEGNKIIWRS